MFYIDYFCDIFYSEEKHVSVACAALILAKQQLFHVPVLVVFLAYFFQYLIKHSLCTLIFTCIYLGSKICENRKRKRGKTNWKEGIDDAHFNFTILWGREKGVPEKIWQYNLRKFVEIIIFIYIYKIFSN
jgi:hypothetical protein